MGIFDSRGGDFYPKSSGHTGSVSHNNFSFEIIAFFKFSRFLVPCLLQAFIQIKNYKLLNTTSNCIKMWKVRLTFHDLHTFPWSVKL